MGLNFISRLKKLIPAHGLIQKPSAGIPERQYADCLAEICGISVFNA